MKNKFTIVSLFLTALAGSALSQTARVQAIHNCADAAASVVDVYIDNTILLDDFGFQEASPYINAPAGTQFTLSVCPSNSVDTSSAIFKKNFTLVNGATYSVVASGGLAQSGATAFDLRAYIGQEASGAANQVSLNIIHGSYDAPEVDIYEVQIPAGELVPDLEFGEGLSAYVDLAATDYDIQVRTQAGIVAAEFDADLTALADSAITVLATGYLDPSSNPGTEPFGLIAVFPGGLVVSLPTKSITPARLQVIHNCAATDAASVDVWLDNTKLIPDFDFRTASSFIDAPAGVLFDVSIQGPMSTDTVNALFKQSFLLESAKTYIVIASGIVGSGTYTPATPFSLEVIADAAETSTTSGNVDVLVWHGATDAPTVDVVETAQGAGTIVDDLSYGEAAGYLDVAATTYALEIRDETGTTIVAKYAADISGLSDQAITILASGFLDPANNNNGEAFGLWVALPTGGDLLELGLITGIEDDNNEITDAVIYPNPATAVANINFNSKERGFSNIVVMDIRGTVVSTEQITVVKGMNNHEINVANLKSGNYFVLFGNNGLETGIQLIKQ